MLIIRSILFILGLLAFFSSTTSASAPDMAWKFKVYLDEKPIGYHDFRITAADNVRTVDIEAEFDVKVLFVNLYRYRHRNIETWQGDCLTGIDAATDANGKDFRVNGAVSESGFDLRNASGSVTLNDCVMSFAYWNPTLLKATQLLNSQTGEYENVTVSREGEEILVIYGERVPAYRYRIDTSTGAISLWYHQDDYRWLALEAPAAGGRTLRYEPVTLPAAAPQLAER